MDETVHSVTRGILDASEGESFTESPSRVKTSLEEIRKGSEAYLHEENPIKIRKETENNENSIQKEQIYDSEEKGEIIKIELKSVSKHMDLNPTLINQISAGTRPEDEKTEYEESAKASELTSKKDIIDDVGEQLPSLTAMQDSLCPSFRKEKMVTMSHEKDIDAVPCERYQGTEAFDEMKNDVMDEETAKENPNFLYDEIKESEEKYEVQENVEREGGVTAVLREERQEEIPYCKLVGLPLSKEIECEKLAECFELALEVENLKPTNTSKNLDEEILKEEETNTKILVEETGLQKVTTAGSEFEKGHQLASDTQNLAESLSMEKKISDAHIDDVSDSLDMEKTIHQNKDKEHETFNSEEVVKTKRTIDKKFDGEFVSEDTEKLEESSTSESDKHIKTNADNKSSQIDIQEDNEIHDKDVDGLSLMESSIKDNAEGAPEEKNEELVDEIINEGTSEPAEIKDETEGIKLQKSLDVMFKRLEAPEKKLMDKEDDLVIKPEESSWQEGRGGEKLEEVAAELIPNNQKNPKTDNLGKETEIEIISNERGSEDNVGSLSCNLVKETMQEELGKIHEESPNPIHHEPTCETASINNKGEPEDENPKIDYLGEETETPKADNEISDKNVGGLPVPHELVVETKQTDIGEIHDKVSSSICDEPIHKTDSINRKGEIDSKNLERASEPVPEDHSQEIVTEMEAIKNDTSKHDDSMEITALSTSSTEQNAQKDEAPPEEACIGGSPSVSAEKQVHETSEEKHCLENVVFEEKQTNEAVEGTNLRVEETENKKLNWQHGFESNDPFHPSQDVDLSKEPPMYIFEEQIHGTSNAKDSIGADVPKEDSESEKNAKVSKSEIEDQSNEKICNKEGTETEKSEDDNIHKFAELLSTSEAYDNGSTHQEASPAEAKEHTYGEKSESMESPIIEEEKITDGETLGSILKQNVLEKHAKVDNLDPEEEMKRQKNLDASLENLPSVVSERLETTAEVANVKNYIIEEEGASKDAENISIGHETVEGTSEDDEQQNKQMEAAPESMPRDQSIEHNEVNEQFLEEDEKKDKMQNEAAPENTNSDQRNETNEANDTVKTGIPNEEVEDTDFASESMPRDQATAEVANDKNHIIEEEVASKDAETISIGHETVEGTSEDNEKQNKHMEAAPESMPGDRSIELNEVNEQFLEEDEKKDKMQNEAALENTNSDQRNETNEVNDTVKMGIPNEEVEDTDFASESMPSNQTTAEVANVKNHIIEEEEASKDAETISIGHKTVEGTSEDNEKQNKHMEAALESMPRDQSIELNEKVEDTGFAQESMPRDQTNEFEEANEGSVEENEKEEKMHNEAAAPESTHGDQSNETDEADDNVKMVSPNEEVEDTDFTSVGQNFKITGETEAVKANILEEDVSQGKKIDAFEDQSQELSDKNQNANMVDLCKEIEQVNIEGEESPSNRIGDLPATSGLAEETTSMNLCEDQSDSKKEADDRTMKEIQNQEAEGSDSTTVEQNHKTTTETELAKTETSEDRESYDKMIENQSDKPMRAYEENLKAVDQTNEIDTVNAKNEESPEKRIDDFPVTRALVEETIGEVVKRHERQLASSLGEQMLETDNVNIDILRGEKEPEKLEQATESESEDQSNEKFSDKDVSKIAISRNNDTNKPDGALSASQESVEENSYKGAPLKEAQMNTHEAFEMTHSMESTGSENEKATYGETSGSSMQNNGMEDEELKKGNVLVSEMNLKNIKGEKNEEEETPVKEESSDKSLEKLSTVLSQRPVTADEVGKVYKKIEEEDALKDKIFEFFRSETVVDTAKTGTVKDSDLKFGEAIETEPTKIKISEDDEEGAEKVDSFSKNKDSVENTQKDSPAIVAEEYIHETMEGYDTVTCAGSESENKEARAAGTSIQTDVLDAEKPIEEYEKLPNYIISEQIQVGKDIEGKSSEDKGTSHTSSHKHNPKGEKLKNSLDATVSEGLEAPTRSENTEGDSHSQNDGEGNMLGEATDVLQPGDQSSELDATYATTEGPIANEESCKTVEENPSKKVYDLSVTNILDEEINQNKNMDNFDHMPEEQIDETMSTQNDSIQIDNPKRDGDAEQLERDPESVYRYQGCEEVGGTETIKIEHARDDESSKEPTGTLSTSQVSVKESIKREEPSFEAEEHVNAETEESETMKSTISKEEKAEVAKASESHSQGRSMELDILGKAEEDFGSADIREEGRKHETWEIDLHNDIIECEKLEKMSDVIPGEQTEGDIMEEEVTFKVPNVASIRNDIVENFQEDEKVGHKLKEADTNQVLEATYTTDSEIPNDEAKESATEVSEQNIKMVDSTETIESVKLKDEEDPNDNVNPSLIAEDLTGEATSEEASDKHENKASDSLPEEHIDETIIAKEKIIKFAAKEMSKAEGIEHTSTDTISVGITDDLKEIPNEELKESAAEISEQSLKMSDSTENIESAKPKDGEDPKKNVNVSPIAEGEAEETTFEEKGDKHKNKASDSVPEEPTRETITANEKIKVFTAEETREEIESTSANRVSIDITDDSNEVPNEEVKESATTPSEQNLKMVDSTEKTETVKPKDGEDTHKNVHVSPIEVLTEETTSEEAGSMYENKASAFVPEEPIHEIIIANEKSMELAAKETSKVEGIESTFADAVSASITGDSELKDEGVPDKTPNAPLVIETSGEDWKSKDNGRNLAEASNVTSKEQVDKNANSYEIRKDEERSKLLSSVHATTEEILPSEELERVQPKAEANHDIVEFDTSQNEEHQQMGIHDLPVSQFLMNQILQEEDDRVDKASDVKYEDIIQEKNTKSDLEEIHIQKQEQALDFLSHKQVKADANNLEDKIESPKKLVNTANLGLEEQSYDIKVNIVDSTARVEEKPLKILDSLSVVQLLGEDVKNEEVSGLASEVLTHTAQNESIKQTSTKKSSPESKLDIEVFMNPDSVSHENTFDTILEGQTTKETILCDNESINKNGYVLCATNTSDKETLQNEGSENFAETKEIKPNIEILEKALPEEQAPAITELIGITETKSPVSSEETVPNAQYPIGKSLDSVVAEAQKLGEPLEIKSEVKEAKFGEENKDRTTEKPKDNVEEGPTKESKALELDKVHPSDILQESPNQTNQIAESLLEKRSLLSQFQSEEATDVQIEEEKTDDEKDEKEQEEHKTEEPGPNTLVMVETRDADLKPAHKKSHNILSGVGSKVKHSIAKVKKAIIGKSSHPKPLSPK